MAPEPAASGLPGAYSGRRVAPSILAADYSRLGEHVGELLAAGARVIHVDVMDGDFVPPISVGPAVAGSIADRVHDADGVLDCHLMIERPEAQIDEFARAGADSITVHFEATAHAHRALGAIREAGCLAGLAMNPGTPVGVAAELGELIDILLCMTVNPGWGGAELHLKLAGQGPALRRSPARSRDRGRRRYRHRDDRVHGRCRCNALRRRLGGARATGPSRRLPAAGRGGGRLLRWRAGRLMVEASKVGLPRPVCASDR